MIKKKKRTRGNRRVVQRRGARITSGSEKKNHLGEGGGKASGKRQPILKGKKNPELKETTVTREGKRKVTKDGNPK